MAFISSEDVCLHFVLAEGSGRDKSKKQRGGDGAAEAVCV